MRTLYRGRGTLAPSRRARGGASKNSGSPEADRQAAKAASRSGRWDIARQRPDSSIHTADTLSFRYIRYEIKKRTERCTAARRHFCSLDVDLFVGIISCFRVDSSVGRAADS